MIYFILRAQDNKIFLESKLTAITLITKIENIKIYRILIGVLEPFSSLVHVDQGCQTRYSPV